MSDDGSFTITYQSDSILITTPQMARRRAAEFIAAVGVKKVQQINQGGKPADAETASAIIQEAKAISN